MLDHAQKNLDIPIFLIALLTFGLNTCHESTEQENAEKEIPTAVLEAFNKANPKAIVREYAEDVKEGKKVHEISFKNNGQLIEIVYSQDGSVIELKETIAAANLPPSIKAELNRRFTEYEIKEAESVTKSMDVFYRVDLIVKSDDRWKKYEILFSKDGLVIEDDFEKIMAFWVDKFLWLLDGVG